MSLKELGVVDESPLLLVVDDVPMNIQVVSTILKTAGYRVVSAGSGPEALDILKEREVELVLLDVLMPQMDGFETSRAINQLLGKQAVPIIFLTSLSEKEGVVQGFE